MKKRLWIYPILCLSVTLLVIMYLKNPIPTISWEELDLWNTKRPLPANIAVDAYLKGNMARENKDLAEAVQAYVAVLEKDPENISLLEDTYTLAMIQGTLAPVLPYLKNMKDHKLLLDYAQASAFFQDNHPEKALALLAHKKNGKADALLAPLVRAWLYAAQAEKEKALNEINSLTGFPFVAGYQKVLLGTWFQEDDLVQKGFKQIGDNTLPAIGYFPLLQNIISKKGNWEKAVLNQKYQELQKTYPATADILVQTGETEITPSKGIAEAFYLVSALGGDGHFTREESLAANTLALLLHPDKQISLIWGAELAEGLRLPSVALSYYKRLRFHSATLGFKEAAALMLLHQTQQALPKLEQLEKTNRTSVPLLTLLGQAYQDTHQREKAIAIYNRLIPLLEDAPKNEPLIQAYLARGLLYGPQESAKMLKDLKHAQTLAPNNAMLLNDLGYHQLEMGLVEEGFDLVQQAYQKQPNDPYILDSMAFGYWKKGQANVALPLAERALDLMPQSALINAHLGDIYAALGRHREAGFQYKKALDLKTDLEESLAQELTQKLKEKKS